MSAFSFGKQVRGYLRSPEGRCQRQPITGEQGTAFADSAASLPGRHRSHGDKSGQIAGLGRIWELSIELMENFYR